MTYLEHNILNFCRTKFGLMGGASGNGYGFGSDENEGENRYRDLLKQGRGERPVEAVPGTGFRPEQLKSYPMIRVGPNLYSAQIEAVFPSEDQRDHIIVDPKEMEDYTSTDNPTSGEFADSVVTYQIRGLEHGGTIHGGAVLSYEDPDPYFDQIARNNDELAAMETEEYPNVVLATNKGEGFQERGLSQVRRLMENENALIRVLGS